MPAGRSICDRSQFPDAAG